MGEVTGQEPLSRKRRAKFAKGRLFPCTQRVWEAGIFLSCPPFALMRPVRWQKTISRRKPESPIKGLLFHFAKT